MVNRVLSTHGLQGCLRCRQTRLPERGNERSSRPEISSEASELEVVPNISVYIPWLNADWCGHTLLQRWEENSPWKPRQDPTTMLALTKHGESSFWWMASRFSTPGDTFMGNN